MRLAWGPFPGGALHYGITKVLSSLYRQKLQSGAPASAIFCDNDRGSRLHHSKPRRTNDPYHLNGFSRLIHRRERTSIAAFGSLCHRKNISAIDLMLRRYRLPVLYSVERSELFACHRASKSVLELFDRSRTLFEHAGLRSMVGGDVWTFVIWP